MLVYRLTIKVALTLLAHHTTYMVFAADMMTESCQNMPEGKALT